MAAGPSDPADRTAARATFTSDAYASETDAAVTAEAVAWLETQSQHPFIRDTWRRSTELLRLKPGERVLEVGCGTGTFLPVLAEAVDETGRVVGLDHAPAFLEEAASRLVALGLTDRVELIAGDALAMPFEDATFDVVHCERVLMHLDDPGAAVREMARVVRPGGRIVAAEVVAHGAMIDLPDRDAVRRILDEAIKGMRSPDVGLQLRRLLLEAGLVDVEGSVVALFETELDPEEQQEFREVAATLVASGELDPTRADAVVATLDARVAAGTYCGTALMFVVAGRGPATRPRAPA
jgi:SAM-dependent methyltransferase